jgi:membrane-bound lytic murein transglycosylase B
MQFIPGTWRRWGADADGDGVADPNQIDDAALTAARYLCAAGSMRNPSGWRTAVLSYNHSEEYVDRVAGAANDYAAKASA